MHYALMIHQTPGFVESLDEQRTSEILAQFLTLRQDPRVLASGRLQGPETATTLRAEDGRTLISDGPFADAKEAFAGIVLIEAADLDEAIELAERIPVLRDGATVEVRPLVAPPAG